MRRTIGASTYTSTNRTVATLRKLQQRKTRATRAMAEEAQRQAQGVFYTDGDGTWDQNAAETIAWKRHEKVMLGRTGALSESIEIRTSLTGRGGKAVGWFGDDHPDSKLTKANLAWVHEKERPWLSKVDDNPVRAEAVFRAGRVAYMEAF